jgi:ankyrin repeat protein|eukprot:7384799-Prymnesium_polylepis.2
MHLVFSVAQCPADVITALAFAAHVNVDIPAPGDSADNLFGGTPLIIACRQFRHDYVRALLSAGAAVNQAWGAEEWTPLSTLCYQCREYEEPEGAALSMEMLECMSLLLGACAEYSHFIISWGAAYGSRTDCGQILGLATMTGGDAADVASRVRQRE